MRIIHNPYATEGDLWLRGNLHAHTTNSDGARTPQEVVDAYAALGYDFLMLSDHDWLTDTGPLDSRGMTLIPGVEVTAKGPHLLYLRAAHVPVPHPDRQAVIHEIRAHHGVAIANHPNWEWHYNHCPQDLLAHWTGYAGLEIYNGVVRRLEGSPLATDRWDRLLSVGRRVWGYANDDSHASDGDDGLAWNVVRSAPRECDAIVNALQHGAFYASTGVEITAIEATESSIRVETANAQRMLVIADYGQVKLAVDGNKLEYRLPDEGEMRYIRVECWGSGEAMAWTQPFFIA